MSCVGAAESPKKVLKLLNFIKKKKTDDFFVAALKNLETGHFFLNNEGELPESRVVIEKGVLWEYNITAEKETILSSGPLKYRVLLMVSRRILFSNIENLNKR